jgi:hypothetical protein
VQGVREAPDVVRKMVICCVPAVMPPSPKRPGLLETFVDMIELLVAMPQMAAG